MAASISMRDRFRSPCRNKRVTLSVSFIVPENRQAFGVWRKADPGGGVLALSLPLMSEMRGTSAFRQRLLSTVEASHHRRQDRLTLRPISREKFDFFVGTIGYFGNKTAAHGNWLETLSLENYLVVRRALRRDISETTPSPPCLRLSSCLTFDAGRTSVVACVSS